MGGVVWKTVSGKLLFYAVLLGVLLTSGLRIAFWSAGYTGVGTSSLTFVILDKLAALFFALTILVFVFMWARAVTIVYAVSISRTYTSAFYGQYVADYAEIILAAFTFALIATLFVLIIVVGVRLGGLRTAAGSASKNSAEMQGKVEEKLRNLKVICVAVGVMVLFLAMRLVLVALRNFLPSFSLGYVTFYGVATLVPEFFCLALALLLVLWTFAQTRRVPMTSGAGKLATNSTYQSGSTGASSIEMSRYEV